MIDDLVRELRYCAVRPGWHFAGGQVGIAQTTVLDAGWLAPAPADPRFLYLTPTGRKQLDRLERSGAA